jgi:hypothetical protein
MSELLNLDAFYESGCRVAKKEWSADDIKAIAAKGYRVIGSPEDGWFVVKLHPKKKVNIT